MIGSAGKSSEALEFAHPETLLSGIFHIRYQIDKYWNNFEFKYDTIRWESLTWTRKLSIQLYLAHVARKRN